MEKFSKFRNSIKNVKKPLSQVRKIKHAIWLIPGWVFYEYYKLNKNKGETKRKSFGHGMKAEAIRLVAFASLPLPGTYELTTTGLAFLKRKIENGDVEKLNLKYLKDFIPIKKLKINKQKIVGKSPYLRIYTKDKKLLFDIIYRDRLKENLFVYGKLMNIEIQKALIGRQASENKDKLIGYKISEIFIGNKKYLTVEKDYNSKIYGFVISLNRKELKLIDKYEEKYYKRKKLILDSGISAWVYLKR